MRRADPGPPSHVAAQTAEQRPALAVVATPGRSPAQLDQAARRNVALLGESGLAQVRRYLDGSPRAAGPQDDLGAGGEPPLKAGEVTRAVLELQRAQGRPVTGVVDEHIVHGTALMLSWSGRVEFAAQLLARFHGVPMSGRDVRLVEEMGQTGGSWALSALDEEGRPIVVVRHTPADLDEVAQLARDVVATLRHATAGGSSPAQAAAWNTETFGTWAMQTVAKHVGLPSRSTAAAVARGIATRQTEQGREATGRLDDALAREVVLQAQQMPVDARLEFIERYWRIPLHRLHWIDSRVSLDPADEQERQRLEEERLLAEALEDAKEYRATDYHRVPIEEREEEERRKAEELARARAAQAPQASAAVAPPGAAAEEEVEENPWVQLFCPADGPPMAYLIAYPTKPEELDGFLQWLDVAARHDCARHRRLEQRRRRREGGGGADGGP